MSLCLRVFVALLVLAPRTVLACPVCFGESDAPMARGTNLGVLFLLGVTMFVLASFASFFIYLMRRASLAAPPLQTEDPVSCSNS